jgi:hypothetical protein
MTTHSRFYNDPAYTARHSAQYTLLAGSAATIAGKFVAFTDQRIKSISANVLTAGTNDGAAYTLNKNGTSSVGVLTLGTNTAGSALSVTLSADITLEAGEWLDFYRIATHGATMAAAVQVEWHIDPNSDLTS